MLFSCCFRDKVRKPERDFESHRKNKTEYSITLESSLNTGETFDPYSIYEGDFINVTAEKELKSVKSKVEPSHNSKNNQLTQPTSKGSKSKLGVLLGTLRIPSGERPKENAEGPLTQRLEKEIENKYDNEFLCLNYNKEEDKEDDDLSGGSSQMSFGSLGGSSGSTFLQKNYPNTKTIPLAAKRKISTPKGASTANSGSQSKSAYKPNNSNVSVEGEPGSEKKNKRETGDIESLTSRDSITKAGRESNTHKKASEGLMSTGGKSDKYINGILVDDAMNDLIKQLDLLHKNLETGPYTLKDNSGKLFIKCEGGFYQIEEYLDKVSKKVSGQSPNGKGKAKVDLDDLIDKIREGFRSYTTEKSKRKSEGRTKSTKTSQESQPKKSFAKK